MFGAAEKYKTYIGIWMNPTLHFGLHLGRQKIMLKICTDIFESNPTIWIIFGAPENYAQNSTGIFEPNPTIWITFGAAEHYAENVY